MFLLLVVTLDAQAEECWVPSPFASFPFTSPTVRFHVPSDPESSITLDGLFRVKLKTAWLPTPFASFPFTSPPVRHRVPPDSVSTLQLYSSVVVALEGGKGSAARPGRTLPPRKDPVLTVQEAGWARGPVWTADKSRPHRGSIPDRPARSQSLYRLSYQA